MLLKSLILAREKLDIICNKPEFGKKGSCIYLQTCSLTQDSNMFMKARAGSTKLLSLYIGLNLTRLNYYQIPNKLFLRRDPSSARIISFAALIILTPIY